ncbi:MAG: class I SAM-dependent methyltransferase [Proteobacteria bacterium]|nr:class I SAM-dependent methyltransferase [Pseudomonadota bacterium]
MITNPELNIWEHSATVRELYAARARGEQEMDAAAQAADILAPLLRPGMSLLDAGCGSGYYYWSFLRRGLEIEYYGIDYSPTLIRIGRRFMPLSGLNPERLRAAAIEDIRSRFGAVLCFNTLSWCPDFRLPLERLCRAAEKYILIRTNLHDRTVYRWEIDGYLDEGYNHLKAYWNIYALNEVTRFMEDEGFEVETIVDRRTGGDMELVVGKPYYWKILLGRRRNG